MTRTFIALEMVETLQHYLGDLIAYAARELPALRWVDAAGIHLTLAFLGELNDDRLAAAMEATRAAAQDVPDFTYSMKGLGIFGSPQQPRVIWMGVEDQPSPYVQGSPLQLAHRVLNRELERRQFEVEKRPFSPHLTLAHVKQPLSPLEQQALQRLLQSKRAAPPTQRYAAGRLAVMKSELSRGGAKYTCLQEYAL
ncbi:MAG TPA: RNA 2',3'-cyclic phosphodiesterase [Ktedonobacteraceae bacterium]|nr:RNA 2',3'-cyclic phosphodiesterase [Ktedonobacteraceae bacterium]